MVSTAQQMDSIRQLLNADVIKTMPLHGGCIADVTKAWLDDGREVVIKTMNFSGNHSVSLEPEGWMLAYLSKHTRLPVPKVFHCSEPMLIMEALPGESRFDVSSQTHAAELLADLHGVRNAYFGLERDTLIGSLPQPNLPTESWLTFFAEQRILAMANLAQMEGKISSTLLNRLERFCERLSRWLTEPEHPSLLHGDAWTTNILARQGRITGFLDPAIYYGHPEIELAFTTLFGTFGEPFFRRYHEIRPIPEGFLELRRDLYNLYPLLVHIRLFGSGYINGVERTLKKVGC
jgi:fructosamine-3-kinase